MMVNKQLVDVKEAKTFIDANWPNDPLLKQIVFNLLDKLPKVEIPEAVHGRWIELPSMEPDYACSECGRSYAWWEPDKAHHCPNCGAKMEGCVQHA